MSGKYQGYPEYKASGLEFLGLIPLNWTVTKFKYAINFQEGPGILAKDFFEAGVPLLRIQNTKEEYVTDDYKTYLDENTVAQKWKQFKVCLGDIIVSCSASTGLVSEVDSRTVGAIPYTGLIRLWPKSKSMVKDFIKYFVQSEVYHKQIEVLQTGATIQHYGPIHLNQISISMPDESGQKIITSFLDHETAKIDTLIEKQQQLIKLLKEKRQAVISHAVTKGLNPNAPLRDSGIKWLGEVPEHWELGYSKWLFRERNTKALITDEMLTASQKHGVIPQKDFMRLEQQKVVQVHKGHDILKHVEPHDFVISMRSFQGGIENCLCKGAVSSAYVPLVPVKEICTDYFKYLFKSKQYIQALQSTTNLVRDGQALRYSNFIQVWLPIAPLDEQRTIADFLNKETVKINELVSKSEEGIELMQERRTALISAAVTGKIDVRGWAAPEPTEAKEKEVAA